MKSYYPSPKFFIFFLFTFFVFFFPYFLIAQTGPNSPAYAVNDASYGTLSWLNVNNAFSSNDIRATGSSTLSNPQSTNYLLLSNFGFAVNPCDNITGIELRIEWSKTGSGTITDDAIKLVLDGVIQSGINKANGTTLTTSDVINLYGSSSDNWGFSLTGSDVNNINFGVAIAVKRNSGGGSAPTPQIDHVTLKLFHSTPPAMSYSTSTVTQITGVVNPNSINNQIIRIDVTANAGCPTIDATSLTFNMNGTTNLGDIANAKLFFTGSVSTFNSLSQLGNTVSSPSGSFSINSFSQTLKTGLNYFWLTVDVSAGAILGNFVDAECTSMIIDATSQIPTTTAPAGNRQIVAPVTITVGSVGFDYTSIQSAYNAVPASLANSYYIELKSNYSDAAEPGTGILFNQKTMNGYFITVRPAAGVTGRQVAKDPGTGAKLWTFDGADNVIIDGRPGGVGTSNQFTVRNTRTATEVANTFIFQNDATNNILTYLNIEGEAGVNNNGVIRFDLSTGTTGNDNNQVSYCSISDITSGGSGNKPNIGIFSKGTSGKNNSFGIIDHCNFFDIFSPASAVPSAGVMLSIASDYWTITNNHFYQTADYSNCIEGSAFIYSVNNPGGHIIAGNFLGGKSTFAGGSTFNITSGTAAFYGIYFDPSTSGNNTIEQNTFSNIKYTTTYNLSSYPLVGIYTAGTGNYTIGSNGTGNVIGSTTLNNNLELVQNGASGLGFSGINNNSSGAVSVKDNVIAGISVSGSRTGANSVIILNSSGSGTTVDNNTIGSETSNSINIISNSNFDGIFNTASSGITITNNEFKNINLSSGTGPYNYYGIDNSAGPLSCLNNNFKNISSSYNGKCAIISHYNGSGTTADINNNAFEGITLSNTGTSSRMFVIEISSGSTVNVYGNIIGNATPGNIQVNGNGDTQIIYKAGTGSLNAINNTIQGLAMTSGGTSTGFEGIYSTSGTFTCTGNTIKDISINTTSTSNFGAIFSSTPNSGNFISQNNITNINYSNGGGAASLNVGIQLKGGGSGLVSKNFVSQISNSSANTSAKLIGIEVFSGNWDLFNNVIMINNNSASNGIELYGIEAQEASLTNSFYHNTVKIYGSQTGNTNSAAVYRTGAGIYFLKNNLFQNLRTGGTGGHYAEYSTIATGTYSTNYNYLEASTPSKLCNYNGTNYSLAGWRNAPVSASNSFSGSISLDAVGKVTTNPFPGAGRGTNLTATVPDDVLGITRGAAPWVGAYEGQNITTSSISPLDFCAGNSLSVGFTIGGSGSFNGSNVFIAQLSDFSGDFSSPVNIGSLGSTTAGSISAIIPPATPTGSGYRIRVVSNDPIITGSDNGSNINIATGPPSAPTPTPGTGISCGSFSANWNSSTGATTYFLTVATDVAFSIILPDYNDLIRLPDY